MKFLIKFIIFLLIIALLIWFAFSIGVVVRLILIASILAYLLNPLANVLEARGIGRTIATALVFIGIISIVVMFIVIGLPLITEEIISVKKDLQAGQGSEKLNRIITAAESRLEILGIKDFDIMQKARDIMIQAGDKIFNYILDVMSLITTLIIIPFISFFMVKDSRLINRQLIRMVPNRLFEFTINLIHKMDLQFGNYIRGQLLESCIIALLSSIALWTLDVDYFLILGAFAGLANLVPYVGPIVGAIPPILTSLFQTGNLATAGYILLAFVIIQLIDNGVLKPVVVGKSVDLHPLMVLLAVIIGGKFFGVLGMVLSIPVTGFVKIIIQESMINFRKYRFL